MLEKADLDFIKGLSVFAALSDDVVVRVVQQAKRLHVSAGEVVFEEGEAAKEMMVVLDGHFEVFKKARDGREVVIAVLGPGDVAGEMSLIDIQPRSAGMRATQPGSLATISHADIAGVYREDHRAYTILVMNISREISLRLRRIDAMLANVLSELLAVTTRFGPPRGELGDRAVDRES